MIALYRSFTPEAWLSVWQRSFDTAKISDGTFGKLTIALRLEAIATPTPDPSLAPFNYIQL